LMNDKVTLDAFLENGALKARDVAQKVLKRTRNKLGLK
ncbi:MAG TPA: tryptophan--tRNA ligase, partial [Flavobacteriaceae bacterium]|nr:tryptophan--tRNA ligase [Flavobacteriaceae bacterium]